MPAAGPAPIPGSGEWPSGRASGEEGRAVTIQAPDFVLYDGQRHSVWTFPLESYGDKPHFFSCMSGMDRGYQATWRVEGETLYLVALTHAHVGESGVGLADVFPGRGPQVEASWFTGTLRIPGDRWAAPRRRQDRDLTFERGRLVRTVSHPPG